MKQHWAYKTRDNPQRNMIIPFGLVPCSKTVESLTGGDMNQKNEDFQSYLRLALPLMARHKVPITPQNYAVWYRYVSGENAELLETINEMLKKGWDFSEEINSSLYNRFGLGVDEKELKKIQADLKQILVSILNEIMGFCGQTTQYETRLSTSVEKLSKDLSLQELKNVISEIISETKTVGGIGKLIQQNLEQKSEELNTLKQEFERARNDALMDFMTGVGNRKAFDENLVKSTCDADREKSDLCLLLVDIDHFKRFNDEHGHMIGDEVIRFVARKIVENVRGRDYVARYGGEEFAVILPKTTLLGAKAVAENIRSFFDQAKLKTMAGAKPLGRVTVSIGASSYRAGEPIDNLVNRADQALYAAKNAGRNRITTENDKHNSTLKITT